ncbi:DUF937 domain-containing protein [Formosa sp. A9]|uniref:DUF937 domain-containing protein n=1 Tax=Formosa sp. A9 TaxID=3442641 RepID=UPI003EB82995
MKTIDVLESVEHYITPALITEIAQILGETPRDVSKTIKNTISSVLLSFLNQANNPAVLEDIINSIYHSNFQPDKTLNRLPLLVSSTTENNAKNTAKTVLNMVLGSKQNDVIKSLRDGSHLKITSVSKILQMITALVMCVIYQLDFNASRLIDALREQEKDIIAFAPVGLLGLLNEAPKLNHKTHKETDETPTFKPKHKWIIPVLLLIAALLLFYVLAK